jgi:hypothetical protein
MVFFNFFEANYAVPSEERAVAYQESAERDIDLTALLGEGDPGAENEHL